MARIYQMHNSRPHMLVRKPEKGGKRKSVLNGGRGEDDDNYNGREKRGKNI